jgi:hypothetical protein
LKTAYLAMMLSAVSATGLCQDARFPSAWHIASESSAFRLEADLDGDGTADAVVLVSDGKQVKLLAFFEDDIELRVVDLLTTTCAPGACAIKLIPAGEYRLSCGESVFECRSGDRATLHAKRPMLALSVRGSDVVFLFEQRRILKMWLAREP